MNRFLSWSRFFYNPYRACRKYYARSGSLRASIYGETPENTLARIACFGELKPTDLWLELGSGRGAGCAWVCREVKCQAIGIEQVPSLFRFARLFFRSDRIEFVRGNFLEMIWPRATFVYAYSTTLSEEEMAVLAKKAVLFLPTGAKIITISGPLPKTAGIQELGSFPVSYPWGDTEAFLHKIF